MAVDLQQQHNRDTTSSFPSSQFQYDDVVSPSQHHNNKNNTNNNKGSYLRALLRSMEVHNQDNNNNNNNNKKKNEDLIDELSHHMDRFLLQDDDDNKFDYSNISSSNNLDLSWDLIGSPQSTVWSTLGSNQGSSEGSSQEPSPPATPCWKSSQDLMGMCDKVKVEESRGNKSKYHHPGNNEIQTLKTTSKSNIDLCSYQSLIQEQIRAIELSKFKQDHAVPPRQKQKSSHGESESQKSKQSEEIQQSQKKGGKGVVGNGRRTTTPRPPRPAPVALQQLLSHQQQSGPGMRALFLGGPVSSGGTGVFFPRSGANPSPPPETTIKKQGKGCATVLIPSRVVQALQLHFDQMSATSGTKAGAFPPLHDVLVSNRDGMYSLQKQQSQEAPENMQNEMLLPQEWTY
ncbi:hypothetical protein RIF29_27834 [Crotalaria pallida]|uniref:Uncharacterized protein n=1 Tax=Crotalaria pallida TaxID=3830 RepID=A0AAN9I2Q9_CROPI